MKKLLIKQPAGLGDICFLQKLATQEQKKHGYEVWWPVAPVYSHLSQYITNFNYPSTDDDFPFKEAYSQCPLNSQTETEDFKIICTDGAEGSNGLMKAKYELADYSWQNWQEFFSFKRNKNKENTLYYDVLNLKDDDQYIFVNNFVGTAPDNITIVDLTPSNPAHEVIYSEMFMDFSLFDWCKVVEGAAEIYIEGSALTYLCEKLDLSATKLHLFSRNHHAIDGLFKMPWEKQYSNQTCMKDL